MPGAHIPSRSSAGGPVRPPSGPPEPIGPGDVVRLVAYWAVLVGGSVAGAVTRNAYLMVGAWLVFALLVVVALKVDGARPDPTREARATADGVVADLRARQTGQDPAARGTRPGSDASAPAAPAPTAPAEPAVPERAVATDGLADDVPESLADLGALVAVRVEERITSLLAVMERRGARAQWRFFLLGIPVGFLVNWASARLWG